MKDSFKNTFLLDGIEAFTGRSPWKIYKKDICANQKISFLYLE